MKTKRRVWSASVIICSAGFFACAVAGGNALAAAAETKNYYVCFSNQNYAVRNANKLTEEGGDYILSDVSLSPAVDFYVTDDAGTRWYAADNDPLSVEETGQYRYDIKFSPERIFSDENVDWEKTDCHVSYRFFVPDAYSVDIDGTPASLSYNPYHTAYDLYCISSTELSGGATVTCGGETHDIAESGYYRILFTPEKRVNGNVYLFDKDGNYGSGEDFRYHLYIEDAPQYYAVIEAPENITTAPDAAIGEKNAYYMSRYENNATAAEYRTAEFFVPERDFGVKYCIYEKTVGGAYLPVDDDGNEDTAFSKLTADDAGWYTLSTTDGGENYFSALREEEKNFGGIYLATEDNGYGFDKDGNIDLSDDFIFKKTEEGDDDYDRDYEQYILNITVTRAQLREGDFEFYITDGKTKYKDGLNYINIQYAGEYKILFSDEHDYGRGRRFKYVLKDGKQDGKELLIGSPQEFVDFAENCSQSADYSKDLSVYLTADLDFAGIAFKPVKNFSGTLYGGYHKLKNITYTEDGKQAAVFITLAHTAVVERLTVENVNLGGKNCDLAGFIGTNYGTVRSVTVSGNVTGRDFVGGVVAYNGRSNTQTGNSDDSINRAKVENCVSYATVSGERYTGGICGQNMGEISSCNSDGAVYGVKNHSSASVESVGGVAGYSLGKIYGCKNNGSVTGGNDGRYAGGIAGLCAGEIYFSQNFGAVSAEEYAGGITGYYGMRQKNDDGLGGITGGGSEESDAVGNVNMLNYTANYGSVTAEAYAGGIVGNIGGLSNNNAVRTLKIHNCASVGDISVTAGSYAGGIVGYGTNAEIKSCLSTGNIQAKGLNGGDYAGGITGYGGSVAYSMSAATVKGEDYVGGIAGYASSSLTGCYTNALILPADDKEHWGAIAGFSQAFNAMTQKFDGVAGNYYVGNGFGIGGTDYGSGFDYAAARIDVAILSADGALSPLLCEEFSREYWQGGDGCVSYPNLRSFETIEDCDEFGDEALWKSLSDRYSDSFTALTADAARLTHSITFMEWNKDNGDLYGDDNEILHENFDVIFTARVPQGQYAEIPSFKYAEKNADGQYVYDGGNAKYYVRFPRAEPANGNITVYAEYCELVTTVKSADDKVLAEGEFHKGTVAEIVRIGEYYTLRFTYGGEEISVGDIKVKFFVGENAENYTVKTADGETTSAEASGKYVSFGYSDGEYFYLSEKSGAELPFWAWLLIGIGSAAAVAGIAALTLFLVKKKKQRTTAK